MSDIPEPWRQVLQAGRAGTRDVVLLQRCPRCGGALRFRYEHAERARLDVNCVSCPWAAASEQVSPEPPWVRELGPEVRTEQGYRSDEKRT
jgi:hypothetical protein